MKKWFYELGTDQFVKRLTKKFSCTIHSKNGHWCWVFRGNGYPIAEGSARTMQAAKVAASTVAKNLIEGAFDEINAGGRRSA